MSEPNDRLPGRPEPRGVPAEVGGAPPGALRRLGSVIGLGTLSILDLLALEDITTAGAWMPEIAFVIASVPALIVLGYYAMRRSGDRPQRITSGGESTDASS